MSDDEEIYESGSDEEYGSDSDQFMVDGTQESNDSGNAFSHFASF